MTLGNMQIIFGLILMIVLGSCKETSTPVVNLTSGTLRQVVPDSARPSWLGPVDDRPERNTFSIQVDFDKKTLSVDGSEPYELSNSDGSTITFKGGVHDRINKSHYWKCPNHRKPFIVWRARRPIRLLCARGHVQVSGKVVLNLTSVWVRRVVCAKCGSSGEIPN
jgi:hypothetical protein